MLRLYDFKCEACSVIQESIVDEKEVPICPVCGKSMVRLPSKFRVNMGPAGAYGYYDENLGQYVSTNRKRKELMRAQGVTEKGGTPKPNGDAWV